MDEVTLTTVQDFIKKNADKDEVKKYISGFVTPDGVKSFIESDEGMKIIQPKLDQHFTKGLETWRTNNLQKIIDEEVNKVVKAKYPQETDEQKRLHKLETDLQSEMGKRQKAEMYTTALQEATAKGLPPELVEHFIGNDPDSTKAGLLKYEQAWKNAIKRETEKIFKQYGRAPEKTESDEGLYSKADVEKMNQKEVLVNRDKILKSMKRW